MKKSDLLKPGSPRAGQLVSLARAINDREDVIHSHRQKTIAAANAWVCEVVLQGADLIKAKTMLKHGD